PRRRKKLEPQRTQRSLRKTDKNLFRGDGFETFQLDVLHHGGRRAETSYKNPAHSAFSAVHALRLPRVDFFLGAFATTRPYDWRIRASSSVEGKTLELSRRIHW